MLDPRAPADFADQVALVTGGAAGIGRAIVERLLAGGARVGAIDFDPARLEELTAALPEHAERLSALEGDVTSAAAMTAAVAAVGERWGRLDVLVNNAGACTFSPVVDMTEEEWDRVMAVNAKGVFLACKAALPLLLRQGGAIVSVASQAGRQGEPTIAHYCASKAGVINFSRALAKEVAPSVRVNCVCPGIVETDMIRSELRWRREQFGDDEGETRATWLKDIPLDRFQQPQDIAEAVAFLASDRARQITGQAISVDGGTIML